MTIFFCYFKVELELGLVMQRLEMKESFDEEIVSWAKAIMTYSKQSCMKTSAIVDATDFKLSCKLPCL